MRRKGKRRGTDLGKTMEGEKKVNSWLTSDIQTYSINIIKGDITTYRGETRGRYSMMGNRRRIR